MTADGDHGTPPGLATALHRAEVYLAVCVARLGGHVVIEREELPDAPVAKILTNETHIEIWSEKP